MRVVGGGPRCEVGRCGPVRFLPKNMERGWEASPRGAPRARGLGLAAAPPRPFSMSVVCASAKNSNNFSIRFREIDRGVDSRE